MEESTTIARSVLPPGLHRGIPMADYLALDAMGSGRLEWLNVSPLHYRYMLEQPREETAAQALGTALHTAVLEPDLFQNRYVCEPLDVAPLNAKPRATNAYKDAVAELEKDGHIVLREDVMAKVRAMANAVRGHTHARRLLERATDRELTMVWERDGHLCRGRADLLGPGLMADLKTTRNLRDFSPWAITKLGYFRQAGWYWDGAAQLERALQYFYFIAVESLPPYDVGVFVLDPAAIVCGTEDCDRLMKLLGECERTGQWPGMFPNVVTANVTDAMIGQLADEAVA